MTTPVETDADRELKAAQTRQAAAEAALYEAQAREADAKAGVSTLTLAREQKKQAAQDASDDDQRVYRFSTDTNSGAVDKCMAKLTEWSRIDPGCDMEIIFSSPGGDVIAGLSLFDHIQLLRSQGHRITTGTVGMAASMAGILLEAGDHRWMGAETWVLIHRASYGAVGSAYQVEDRVEWVRRIEKRIVDIFVSRSNGKLSVQRIRKNWERRDWWLSSEEALKLGLVDEVRGVLPESAA